MPNGKMKDGLSCCCLASFATRYMPNGNRMAIFHRAHPTKTPFSHSISRKILTQLYGNKIEQAATGNRPSDRQGQATQKHQWKETKKATHLPPRYKERNNKSKNYWPFCFALPFVCIIFAYWKGWNSNPQESLFQSDKLLSLHLSIKLSEPYFYPSSAC